MSGPQQFERLGKAFLGHAIAIRMAGGSEVMIFAPTKDEAVIAAESLCEIDVDLTQVKRAALGPVSAFKGAQP